VGVDVSPIYTEQLNKKQYHSFEPHVNEYLRSATNFRATTSLAEGIQHSNLIYIIVPTPNTGGSKPYDHSLLGTVLQQINEQRVTKKHIVIGCTVLPGYVAEVGRFLVRDCVETTLSYNPEFVAQGEIINGLLRPDMILIGEGSKEAGDILEELYKKTCNNEPKICRMSPESAEITKLAVNCFITMKISFSNMIGDMADCTSNANKLDIMRAVGSDSRIGAKYLTPGYGFGGPCFPRDNRALGSYSDSIHVPPLLSRATDEYNKYHAQFMIEQFMKENRNEYIFENVAYKENCAVPLIEESQKLVVAKGLAQAGRKVIIRDNQPVIREVEKEFGKLFHYEIK